MKQSKLFEKLEIRESTLTLKHVLDNSKADSGGERDVNFIGFLIDNRLLERGEAALKRTSIGTPEEYYLERYKKMSYESDRHFLCRTIIQDELKRLEIDTFAGLNIGNMNVLRANSSYDIVTADFSTIIDVGLTPARNYFRGLTDLRIRSFLLTTYFDDYMDDITFFTLNRKNDDYFIDAVKDYEEGFKQYIPSVPDTHGETKYYTQPHMPD